MLGQGYFTQPDGQGIVFPGEVGPGLADPSVPRPGVVTRTRTPITSRFRKIGNPSPGVLGDIQIWWAGIPKKWRWGILGGIGTIGVIIAAVQGKGKGKGSWLKKI